MNDSVKLPPHLSAHPDTALRHSALSPTEPLSPTEAPLVLELKGNDGQEVSLTSSQLESWFASIEKDEMNATANNSLTPSLSLQELQRDPYFATQFVGRYGIKSAKDVIAFLKSPAGDSVKLMIGEELAQVAALDEFKRQEYQTHEIRQHRLLAFLLLGLLYKEAHARHVVEVNSQQAEARVQQGEAAIAKDQQKALDKKMETLNQTLSSFNNTATAIQSQISQKEQELNNVQRELQSINQEEMALRYDTFDRHLTELDNHLQLPALEMDEQIASLEMEKAALEAQLKAPDPLNNALVDPNAPAHLPDGGALHNRIQQLSERIGALKEQKVGAAHAHLPLIEVRINQLSGDMEDQLLDIQQLLERNNPGDEEKARQLLQEHNGLHLQVAGLKDMMSVLKGEKVLYKDNGEIAKSFDEAAFVVPRDKKVVKREDKFYLIGANQDLDSMSPQDIQQAQRNFERARPELSTLKLLVQHNHGLENERLEKAQAKSKSLHNDLIMLRNQLNQIQAARSEVVAQMQALNPTITPESLVRPSIPTPTPFSNPGTSVGQQTSPSQAIHTTQAYKMLAEIIKRLPSDPQRAGDKLKEGIENLHHAKGKPMDKTARDLLKVVVDAVRSGLTPIPKIPMDTLIRCMPYFGVEQEKRNVMPPTPTSQTSKTESPTPFSTTLKM